MVNKFHLSLNAAHSWKAKPPGSSLTASFACTITDVRVVNEVIHNEDIFLQCLIQMFEFEKILPQ